MILTMTDHDRYDSEKCIFENPYAESVKNRVCCVYIFWLLVCIKFEKTHFHCHICHRFSFPAPKKTAAERGKTESELLIIVN